MKKATRVLVTNALQYLPKADSIVVLDDGEVVDVGTYKELMAKGLDFATLMAAHGVGAFYLTLVPVRPRRRGERRSLRTFPGVSLRPHLAFNPRPRRLSTPTDAFQLHLTPFNSRRRREKTRVARRRIRPAVHGWTEIVRRVAPQRGRQVPEEPHGGRGEARPADRARRRRAAPGRRRI